VSRRAALEPIAQNGHLCALNRSLDSLFRLNGSLEVASVGVHRASTFHGLCSSHDSRLFRRIDTAGEYIDLETAVLHFYRAVCHEMYLKDWSIDVNHRLNALYGPNPLSNTLKIGSAWAALVLMEFLERCEEALLANRFSGFGYTAFVSEAAPFMVSSSVWFPDRDFHGRKLQDLPQADHLPGCVGLFALPHREGSVILLVWHRDTQWCTDRLFHSLSTAYPPADMGTALIRMILSTSENVFFKPSWWASRSPYEQALFLSVWKDKVNINLQVDPMYLRALDNINVEFQVAGVDQP